MVGHLGWVVAKSMVAMMAAGRHMTYVQVHLEQYYQVQWEWLKGLVGKRSIREVLQVGDKAYRKHLFSLAVRIARATQLVAVC